MSQPLSELSNCVLCTNISKHNLYIEAHKRGTPKAPLVAAQLGVTADQILKHRRHRGNMTVLLPVKKEDVDFSQTGNAEPASSVADLQALQRTLHQLLTSIQLKKDQNPNEIVRIVSVLKDLIISSEDMQIKLVAAAGSRNSAFTQDEVKEIFTAFEGLCPACREKACALIKPSS